MQIHLDPSYIDKTGWDEWTILKPFVIVTPYGLVLIWDRFKFDKDSVVRNSPDWVPSCVHDLLFVYQIFLDGSLATRYQADRSYYTLNRNSIEPYNRKVATRRYWGLRLLIAPWVKWNWPGRPEPLPAHAEMLRQQYLETGRLGVG